jgi:putative transposase
MRVSRFNEEQIIGATWKDDYNTVRPHSALGNLAPAIYAKLSVPAMQRDGTLGSASV